MIQQTVQQMSVFLFKEEFLPKEMKGNHFQYVVQENTKYEEIVVD